MYTPIYVCIQTRQVAAPLIGCASTPGTRTGARKACSVYCEGAMSAG